MCLQGGDERDDHGAPSDGGDDDDGGYGDRARVVFQVKKKKKAEQVDACECRETIHKLRAAGVDSGVLGRAKKGQEIAALPEGRGVK